MAKFKMTREQRVEFFYRVVTHVGQWDRNTWRDNYYPENMSTVNEMFPVLESIIKVMVKYGVNGGVKTGHVAA